jgi:hypothetical protein
MYVHIKEQLSVNLFHCVNLTNVSKMCKFMKVQTSAKQRYTRDFDVQQ